MRRCSKLIIIVALLAAIPEQASAARLASQPPAQQPPGVTPPPARDTAALVVQNRVITIFRSPLGALSPTERAEAAARRIEAIIETVASDSVDTRPIPEGVLIRVAGRAVFS